MSVDSRPPTQPDERGTSFPYKDNSTARMLNRLEQVDSAALAKLMCFESRSTDLARECLQHPPDLCFIDGEHTDRAAFSDFEFCLSVCAANAVIVMHDANLVAAATSRIHVELRKRAIPFRGIKLQGSIYALALRSSTLRDDPTIRTLATNATVYFLKARLWLMYVRFWNRCRQAGRMGS